MRIDGVTGVGGAADESGDARLTVYVSDPEEEVRARLPEALRDRVRLVYTGPLQAQ